MDEKTKEYTNGSRESRMSATLVRCLTGPTSRAGFSYRKTENLIVYLGAGSFQFSGELDPARRHVGNYVLDARISRFARCFGALQRSYPAIQRVGHPKLAPRSAANSEVYQQTTSAGLGSVAAWPVAARAQQAGKIYHVAWIFPAMPVTELTENSGAQFIRAFVIELRRLGYSEARRSRRPNDPQAPSRPAGDLEN